MLNGMVVAKIGTLRGRLIGLKRLRAPTAMRVRKVKGLTRESSAAGMMQ